MNERVVRRAAECGVAAPGSASRPAATTPPGADTDTIADAMEHVLRETIALDARCPAGTLDRAIVLIARRHAIHPS